MGISLSLGRGVYYRPGLLVSLIMLLGAMFWALILGAGYILYAVLIWPTRTLLRRYA